MRVLCGDIGGTNARLLIAEVNKTLVTPVVEHIFSSQAYASFEAVLNSFLAEVGQFPEHACFAIAGPVIDGKAKITNLPWQLDQQVLLEQYTLQRVSLINDFSAIAYGVSCLEPDDFRVIQQGQAHHNGARLFIGAGTGLGVVQSHYNSGQWSVLPSEGGHMAFAPADDTEVDILQWLLRQQDYVSHEDLLSGRGLVTLYRYFFEQHSQTVSPTDSPSAVPADTAAEITYRVSQGLDGIAVMAMDRFVRIYGAQTGNLALLSLPYGGIYIAGGIAAKNADHLCQATFLQPFCRKGAMSSLMGRFPVKIILNERVGLLGAALHATTNA